MHPATLVTPQTRLTPYLRAAQAIAALALLFTVIAPPWTRVRLEMQEALYHAREVRVLDEKFAGHRLITAGKQSVDIGRHVPGNFYRFEREEYRIAWLVLLAEWIALGSCLIVAWTGKPSVATSSVPPSEHGDVGA